MVRGKLIVFEGADDLGKSTQIEALYNYLSNEKKKVIKTREPGSTKLGSKIREILLNTKEKIEPLTQLLLFEADRHNHYQNILKPYLDQGYTILCDRFYLSTLVYQHKMNGISENLVSDLNGLATNYLVPDITFVFHGERLTQEFDDEYEKQLGNNSHNILNNYYMDYGRELPNHILINANRDKQLILEEILANLPE